MEDPSSAASATPKTPNEEEAVADLQATVLEMERTTRSFIQRNPTTSVVGAVVVGFVLGRLVMR